MRNRIAKPFDDNTGYKFDPKIPAKSELLKLDITTMSIITKRS